MGLRRKGASMGEEASLQSNQEEPKEEKVIEWIEEKPIEWKEEKEIEWPVDLGDNCPRCSGRLVRIHSSNYCLSCHYKEGCCG